MAEVDLYCNISISHSYTPRGESLIRHFLTPQDVRIKDRDGNSPLHIAAASDDVNIVELLLSLGASINDTRMDGLTPLHLAVNAGKESNVRLLLDYGARADVKDLFGKTPLHLSVAYSHRQDERKMTRIAKMILDRGVAKALLNESTDSGETVLYLAVLSGGEDSVKLLLRYGANVNAKNRDGKSPLHFAVELRKSKVVKLLLENGARINEKTNSGSTALHEAVNQRTDRIVELLLSYGAEVNAKDAFGKTALHLAAQSNYVDDKTMDCIVKLLLDKAANVNEYTYSGETAFHCAIITGNERLVRLFLDYGADVNMKNFDGKSPLHYAIQYSNKNIVKLLLDRGARIDERTNDGKLALHVAVAVEDENIIKILLENNADINGIDKSGKTPLSLAFEVAHMRSIYNPWNGFCPIHSEIEMFEMLVKHIAKLSYVCEENLRMILNDEKLKVYYQNCLEELKSMKENKVCDNITMFKVLTKNNDTLVGYSRNENLRDIFELDVHAHEYPIYYCMLKERFFSADSRRKLLEPSTFVFRELVQPVSIPDIITDEILSYLTIEDLTNLAMT